jgi:amino acid permease
MSCHLLTIVVFFSLGTFVFTYVSQHTVHLVFDSLQPNLRTISNWKKVSGSALSLASVLSLSVSIFVYMTFWQSTESDIFQIYPGLWQIDVAKLLLCVTMLLTFPLPFFTCRELLVVTFVHPFCKEQLVGGEEEAEQLENDLQEPLLPPDQQDQHQQQQEDHISSSGDADTSIASEISRVVQMAATPKHWLMPDDNRQLVLVGHVIVTIKLWIVITCLAIAAPSLGDVLDLVGCATGTIIAFIIPALLSFSIEGYSHLALLILLVGGAVGTVGTFYSLKKLFFDLHL